jgi:hypothetical protein
MSHSVAAVWPDWFKCTLPKQFYGSTRRIHAHVFVWVGWLGRDARRAACRVCAVVSACAVKPEIRLRPIIAMRRSGAGYRKRMLFGSVPYPAELPELERHESQRVGASSCRQPVGARSYVVGGVKICLLSCSIGINGANLPHAEHLDSARIHVAELASARHRIEPPARVAINCTDPTRETRPG